jgi:creatinine amidohydrolase
VNLETLTYPEVATLIEEHVPLVLPVGAIEQHGPHLPLGTDGFIPYELARRVAEGRRLLIAPPMFYGAYSRPRSGGGRHFPGSVGLSGHMENSWTLLEAIEQAIGPYRDSSRKALLVHWWEQIQLQDVEQVFGNDFPGWNAEHASILETSMFEYLRPELVRADLKAAGGAKRMTTYDIFPPPDDILWPNGIGNTALPASAEIGKQLVDLLVKRIGEIIDGEFSR